MVNQKNKNSNNNKKGKKGKQDKQRGNAVGRAPTSISVRGTTRGGGSRQEMMVAEVDSRTGTFTLHSGNIPWLKGVAKSYQRWNLSGLKVWYEPRVGTLTNGMIHLAHQLDSADATPQTVGQISAISGASRTAVWDINRKLNIPPRAKALVYSSPSSFQLMDSNAQNEHSLGRVSWVADVDANQFPDPKTGVDAIPVGYIWISYVPVLLDPIDPDLND